MKVTLKKTNGQYKIISLENDMVLLVLSIFGWGWIKLLVDGRVKEAIFYILLAYTLIGHIIYGIYLAVKPNLYIDDLVQKGAKAVSKEDADQILTMTGITVEVSND